MREQSRFLTPLRVEQIDNGKWLVREALIFLSTEQEKAVIVPAQFITDFASVPRLPIIYLAMGNTAHAASVLHDYLYTSGELSRKDADDMFLEAMKVTQNLEYDAKSLKSKLATMLGIPLLKRWAMYSAVRVAGFTRYKKG